MFDFGIGGSEILLVAVVALIVIGPKDLPKVLRALGKMLAKVRGMASEFQGHLNEAMKDTGVDELRREVSNLKSIATTEISMQADAFMKAQEEAQNEMKKMLDADEAKAKPTAGLAAPEAASPEASATDTVATEAAAAVPAKPEEKSA